MGITFDFGPFRLREGESLWLQDAMIPLSPLQLRLLALLCRHPQQLLEKEQIAHEVWGHTKVSDVSLARAVHGLRSRLSQGARASELIRNIYGRGYILTVPVQVREEAMFQSVLKAESAGEAPPRPLVQAVAGDPDREATRHRQRITEPHHRRASVIREFTGRSIGA